MWEQIAFVRKVNETIYSRFNILFWRCYLQIPYKDRFFPWLFSFFKSNGNNLLEGMSQFNLTFDVQCVWAITSDCTSNPHFVQCIGVEDANIAWVWTNLFQRVVWRCITFVTTSLNEGRPNSIRPSQLWCNHDEIMIYKNR